MQSSGASDAPVEPGSADAEEAALRGLTATEAVRLHRMFSAEGTLDDARALRRSLAERGAVLPARWAARAGELGPVTIADWGENRDDVDAPQFQDGVPEARPGPLLPDDLSDAESELAAALTDGTATVGQGMALYTSMTARGIGFPIEWEERLLRICLEADPERTDLLGRYRTVLIMLGRPVPLEMERRFAAAARQEEYEADHQLAAKQYHLKTGLNDVEPEFRLMVEQVRPFTMTSMERLYALFQAVRYVVAAEVPGAFVECGVWRGGSMMLIAQVLMALGRSDRDLFLFDTFEGLPRPDAELDIDIWGNRAIDGWLPKQVNETSSHWAEAGLEEVRTNMVSTGYPIGRIHFVKGMVEKTIPDAAPGKIALLRLDTDWYASTKHEMEHLYPCLTPSGVLIIDDYGHFEGARRAVDEYIKECGLNLLLNRIDYSGRMALKPRP